MAETAQIAKMAKLVSDDIFSVFGWSRRPHEDLNFPCGDAKGHKKKTHPSDVVFSYDSPIEENRIYLNTDLKSYAAASVTVQSVKDSINSLILAVDCANRSPVWRERYAGENKNYDVHGLLFVYNHDTQFDKNWPNILNDASVTAAKLKAKHRIFILGPTDIEYLVSVADDIVRQRGANHLPSAETCKFHYPDMINTRVKRNLNEAATIEVLTSARQVLSFTGGGVNKNESGSYCYYRGEGKSSDEFKFLIDYLFRFQLVGDDNKLSIRMPFLTSDASSRFETAKEEYWKDHHSLPEFKNRLSRINLVHINRIRQTFDETQLGMEP